VKPTSHSLANNNEYRAWYRFLNASVRGAGAGLCLRGGLHLLSWFFALLSTSRRKRLLLSPLRVLLDQFVDTVRYTLFLGSLSGVYVAADESIAQRFGRQRYTVNSTWPNFAQVSAYNCCKGTYLGYVWACMAT